MADIFDMADTWNAGGTTFTAIKMDATDTASAAGSMLMNLLKGGVSQLSVGKNAGVDIRGSDKYLRLFNVDDPTNFERGFMRFVSNTLEIGTEIGGSGTLRPMTLFGGNALGINTGGTIRWYFNNATLVPNANNAYDLGTTSLRVRAGYFAGTLSFGTHTALGGESVTGYITITDAGGTSRKLAVVS